jgi:hypothetical protein
MLYQLLVMTKAQDEPQVMAEHWNRDYMLTLRDMLNARSGPARLWLVYAESNEQWEEHFDTSGEEIKR